MALNVVKSIFKVKGKSTLKTFTDEVKRILLVKAELCYAEAKLTNGATKCSFGDSAALRSG